MKLRKLIILVAISFLTLFCFRIYAAPAMPQDTCRIEGKIVSIKERAADIPGRKIFGESGLYTYIDIDIEVRSRSLFESVGLSGVSPCAAMQAPKVITYQLRADQQRPQTGQKIRALTKFEGDEFSIGDWIYQIEVLP